MTWYVWKSINTSDYGHIFACGAIYSQNVVLKTFSIWNDTRTIWQHLVAKSELFRHLWYDPAIKSMFSISGRLFHCNVSLSHSNCPISSWCYSTRGRWWIVLPICAQIWRIEKFQRLEKCCRTNVLFIGNFLGRPYDVWFL